MCKASGVRHFPSNKNKNAPTLGFKKKMGEMVILHVQYIT